MSFRGSKYQHKNEYISYELDTPITMPANNANQRKTGYRFVCDNTGRLQPNDYYNAYFDVTFKVNKKADGSAYAAGDKIAMINGAHSIIRRINATIEGVNITDTNEINKIANVKNLMDLSKPKSENMGELTYFYPDTTTSAEHIEFDETAAVAAGSAVPRHRPKRNANYNEGFAKRKNLIEGGVSVNVQIPLDRYGFFESLQDHLCPSGKVIIELDLESDNELIYRNGGDEGRVVVERIVLWVPRITFNVAGEKLFLEKYMTNQTWSYLNERIEVSNSTRDGSGVFKITSGIRKPRHVFVWGQASDKLEDQTKNPFTFDTFSMPTGKVFSSAQLEYGNGDFYPQEAYQPERTTVRPYVDLMGYNDDIDNPLSAPLITPGLYKNLYGMFYFDLRNHGNNSIDESSVKLSFRYSLNGNADADYRLYALILYEETIRIDIVGGKTRLMK